MREETAWVISVIVFFAFCSFATKGCLDVERVNQSQRAAVQVKCLESGATALECKELK